jgi:hypothetical protein
MQLSAILFAALLVITVPQAKATSAAAEIAQQKYVLNRMGMTITRFDNATDAKESTAYKNANPENPAFLLCNYHPQVLAVQTEINFYHGRGIRTKFRDPEFPQHEALMIQSGACTLVGNVTSDVGDHGYSGAMFGFLGCDENGLNCDSVPGIITKPEFATNVQGKPGIVSKLSQ